MMCKSSPPSTGSFSKKKMVQANNPPVVSAISHYSEPKMNSKVFLFLVLGKVGLGLGTEGFEESEMYCGLENMSIKIPKATLDEYLKQSEDFGSAEIYIGRKDEGGCETNGVRMDDWYLFETRLDSQGIHERFDEPFI